MRPVTRPIRSRLVHFATLISVVAILLVTAVSALYAYQSRLGALEDELRAIGSILSANLQAPLAFADRDAAMETLAPVTSLGFIEVAQLLDADGAPVTTFGQAGAVARWPATGMTQTADHLLLTLQIDREGRRLGTLRLAADLGVLDSSVRSIILLSAVVLVAATMVSWLMARILGNAISRPIEHLAATMEKVTTERDYGHRAHRTSDDETGTLIDGFNNMLDTIARNHRDLADARDRAEDANRSKSHFLATMSHELRTPLNAIMGFSEVIRDRALGDAPERYSDYSADVYNSASYLLSLINDLLDMARLDSHTYQIHPEELSSAAWVEQCLRMIRPQAEAKSVALATHFSDRGVTLTADVRGLRQVLLNVLGNAVKFTPAQGQIELRESMTADGSYRISVKDNGPGIPEADLERVLEPFEQAASSISREHGGTGLGLSISAGIMELHGGSLTLESEYGKGTKAIVTIPASRVSADPSPVHALS
ncbi:ATP-binding protein [Nisaea sp.]|uniref:ATP-binding protein n=1 Tax=Nisaea sp. TaxID=2024842 RepID=UPI003B51ECF0